MIGKKKQTNQSNWYIRQESHPVQTPFLFPSFRGRGAPRYVSAIDNPFGIPMAEIKVRSPEPPILCGWLSSGQAVFSFPRFILRLQIAVDEFN